MKWILIAMLINVNSQVSHISPVSGFEDKPACDAAAVKIQQVVELRPRNQTYFYICTPASSHSAN